MKLRDKGKYPVEITAKMAATPDVSEDKNLLIEKDNTLIELQAALQQLSKEQQVCVTLFYLEKKSYTEISGKTGYSMMQVKSHIQNGKRNLKLLLEKKLNHGR
jgi:RNA polymerase sigma-70 factor (ECF subfamily)